MNDEDKTKNGEFVPSFFEWITLDEQKKRAEELANLTKLEKSVKKKGE